MRSPAARRRARNVRRETTSRFTAMATRLRSSPSSATRSSSVEPGATARGSPFTQSESRVSDTAGFELDAEPSQPTQAAAGMSNAAPAGGLRVTLGWRRRWGGA